ncbi:hypothetical protein EVAR_12928_1 [Eumeta japonica]|uniref:Uncharacterized protein n=1 Tax=Eumeta variegata TaxID=151549 RepID=A0A4C1TVS6_EUMVA|nr:hypothetical protein EVAR_12928_1 [Eumeta japonica]
MIQIGIDNRTGIGIEDGIAMGIMINYRDRSTYKVKELIPLMRVEPRVEIKPLGLCLRDHVKPSISDVVITLVTTAFSNADPYCAGAGGLNSNLK